mgnify:CR=1 FL=1
MIMEKIGNIVLSALIALLGVVILVESNDNKIDIKISNKENLNVKNIKNGENEVTPNEKLDNKDQNNNQRNHSGLIASQPTPGILPETQGWHITHGILTATVTLSQLKFLRG